MNELFVEEINTGFCIKNDSPHDETYCDCYKVNVPYNVLGHAGIIKLCRGWVDYCIEYRKGGIVSWSPYSAIREKILKVIKEKYPQLNDDDYSVYASDYAFGMNSGHAGIVIQLMPKPFNIYLRAMPSVFINKIFKEGQSLFFWDEFYVEDKAESIYISKEQMDKFKRQMKKLSEFNLYQVKDYITHTKHIKKYSSLIDELTKQINKYERI